MDDSLAHARRHIAAGLVSTDTGLPAPRFEPCFKPGPPIALGGFAIGSGPDGPIRRYTDQNGTMHTDLLKVTMSALVELLFQDRPVIDMTNLKGSYQVSMERLSQAQRCAARVHAAMLVGITARGTGPAIGRDGYSRR
jgi:hypothetical protein